MRRGGLRGGSTSFGNLARRPPTLVSTYIRILDAAAAFSGGGTGFGVLTLHDYASKAE